MYYQSPGEKCFCHFSFGSRERLSVKGRLNGTQETAFCDGAWANAVKVAARASVFSLGIDYTNSTAFLLAPSMSSLPLSVFGRLGTDDDGGGLHNSQQSAWAAVCTHVMSTLQASVQGCKRREAFCLARETYESRQEYYICRKFIKHFIYCKEIPHLRVQLGTP